MLVLKIQNLLKICNSKAALRSDSGGKNTFAPPTNKTAELEVKNRRKRWKKQKQNFTYVISVINFFVALLQYFRSN